ncbi:unnamed protein product [Trichobilharzia szidati]|nr:unnamed protein product [Trichobilharzia szidati]
MSTVTDDEIIKRKLLIEGESGNDDRRITLLLKNYLRWVASDDVGEDGYEAYQALIASVCQCENAMEQSSLVIAMNYEQQKQYEDLYKEIENAIESAKNRIQQCKEDLRSAKTVRKNRREYDSLAKVLSEHPERHKTLEKYTKLKATLERLEKLNEEYDQKIKLRKTQFHLFLVALKGLQKIVEDDEPLSSNIDDLMHIENTKSVNEDDSNKMDTI